MTPLIDITKVLLWLLATFLALSFTAYSFGYRLNTSHSYPQGLYVVDTTQREGQRYDKVLLCPPPHASVTQAIERGYLTAGRCESGSVPMIKRIAAVAGDRVTLESSITIEGRYLPGSTLLTRDSQGRPLMPYRHHGKTRFWMPQGTVFVHSDHAPGNSFDSRYFGPVPVENIQGTIKPVLLRTDLPPWMQSALAALN